ADDSAMVTIKSPTTAATCGTVDNRAWADANNDDPVNDTADVVVQCPDLMIDKEALTDTVSAGDTIKFKINVWNVGPGDADSVMLVDTLPNGGLSWFEVADPGNDCSIASDILTCDFGTLMADDTSMITVGAVTDADDCGTVPNKARASAANDTTVMDSDTLLVQCPDLNIEKIALTDTVMAGDTIRFKINVWNAGPGDADSVMLVDTLPNGGLSWFEVSDPGADCSIASDILTCDFGTLMANDTSMITVGAETDTDDCGVHPNKAWASAANDTTEMASDTALVIACGNASLEPTQTSCEIFLASGGNNPGLDMLFAQKKGNPPIINSVSPGVFFFYVEFTAPAASFDIDVVQSNDDDIPKLGLFQILNMQAFLYDANCSKLGDLDLNAGMTGVDDSVAGLTAGAKYVIGIKYDSQTLKGEDFNDIGTGVVYDFDLLLDGLLDATDALTLKKKNN
ncbi:MAG: hypothetical protein ABFS34_16320, partial [Gemmatimonadota bacterium]